MKHFEESKRVTELAENHSYTDRVHNSSCTFCGKIFSKHMVGNSVLELGPAEGVMTEYFWQMRDRHNWFEDYTVVDGGQKFIEDLQERYPGIKTCTCLFEDYTPDRKFDNIILGHVLEHVEKPVDILQLCKTWLSDEGRIFCAVPNAGSLHRQAAVIMGLLETLDSFSQKDIAHGHRRVFNQKQLQDVFIQAGLRIKKWGGYWLKPLSDRQIEESWSEDLIHAYMLLGEKYPNIAGEIYVIAAK